MPGTTISTLALFLFVLTVCVSAQDSTTPVPGSSAGFTIEAVTGYGIGNTIYELSALTPDPRDAATVVPIRSRLDFPLDGVTAGGRISWDPDGGPLDRWSFSTEVSTNLNDPKEKMVDQDFVNNAEVIHTESDARLDLITGSGKVGYRITGGRNTSFTILFRTDHQRVEQHIEGYTGWQASLITGRIFEISRSGPVLDYRVTYWSHQLGGAFVHRFGDHVGLGLEATGGILFADDFDDHILRNRVSEGDGTGFGMNALVKVELLRGSLPLDALSLTLAGGMRWYRAEGGVDQFFRNSEGVVVQRYMDLPYIFESFQGNAGLSVSYSF